MPYMDAMGLVSLIKPLFLWGGRTLGGGPVEKKGCDGL